MIAGIFDGNGTMASEKPGVSLTSASEVLLCSKVVESVLPRLSPGRKAKIEDMFAPLGAVAFELQGSVMEAEDEEEMSRLLDELDATSDAGTLETAPVVGMDQKTGRFLEVMLKKYAEREDSGVAAAISTMHLLLLPQEASHPTIEARLF